jgi:hypothetical protein
MTLIVRVMETIHLVGSIKSSRKEREMETAIKAENVIKVNGKKKKKRSGWDAFINFLACGGFLLIIVALVGIVIFVSIVFKIKF